MKHHSLLILAIACLTAIVSSCSKEEEAYPNIITEMADMYTDAEGVGNKFTTDAGVTYTVTNGITDLAPNAFYRILCGYVPSGNNAAIYQAQSVFYLRDSTEIAKTDPTDVMSAWRAGKYINIYLAPLTQGGTQYWGFIIEKIESGHAWVRLHHNQNNDPRSYTQPTYASLPVDDIKGIQKGDIITLSIYTSNGIQTWDFKK